MQNYGFPLLERIWDSPFLSDGFQRRALSGIEATNITFTDTESLRNDNFQSGEIKKNTIAS